MSSERIGRNEPIKRIVLKSGKVRYRLLMDVGRHDSGKRRQVCSTHDTLKEARNEEARVRTEMLAGTYVARRDETVREYIERWLASRHNLKPKTVIGYRDSLSPVTKAHGSLKIQDLTKGHIDALVTEMLTTGGRKGKGRSARTVSLMLTVLQHALDDAANENLVTKNVAALVDKPKAEMSGSAGQAWTPDQARTFLRHVSSDRLCAAWRLSLYGLRRGEVLGLSWEDVDLDAHQAHVVSSRVVAGRQVVKSGTKNRKGRVVPLGAEVVADLKALKTLQARERLAAGEAYTVTGLIVVDPMGVPLRPERYSDLFHMHADAAGLPRIRLHDLRHTAASLLAANGVPIVTAAALLGHDPMVYAKTYAHHYADDLRKASDVLSGLYSEAQ